MTVDIRPKILDVGNRATYFRHLTNVNLSGQEWWAFMQCWWLIYDLYWNQFSNNDVYDHWIQLNCHPPQVPLNIDVISRFQLSKISSQVIVVCSPVLNNATICPLQGSWQVNAGGTRHADQTWFVRDLSLKWEREKKPRSCENFSLRKYLTAEISILNQCLISLAKQTHFTTRKLAVLYTRPSISGLEQSVPRRAPSTSGSF